MKGDEDSVEIEEVDVNEKSSEILSEEEKEPIAEDTTSEHPVVVVVFATAVIESSPTEVLSKSELKNLQTLDSETTILCQTC